MAEKYVERVNKAGDLIEREQTIERLSRQILEDHAFHPSFDNIRYWMGQAYDAGCGSSQESAEPSESDDIAKKIIIDTEVRQLQRSFEGLGTVSDKTSEPLMRAALGRVWDAARSPERE